MESLLWILPGLASLLSILVSIALIVVAIMKVRPVHQHAGHLMAGGAALALLVRVANPFLNNYVIRIESSADAMATVVRINSASGMLGAVGAMMVVVGIALLAERQRPEPKQF